MPPGAHKKKWRADSRCNRFIEKIAAGRPFAHDCEATLLFLTRNFASAAAAHARESAINWNPTSVLEEGEVRRAVDRLRRRPSGGDAPKATARADTHRAALAAARATLAKRIRGESTLTQAHAARPPEQQLHSLLREPAEPGPS
jgi:hypothetical protein